MEGKVKARKASKNSPNLVPILTVGSMSSSTDVCFFFVIFDGGMLELYDDELATESPDVPVITMSSDSGAFRFCP